MTIKEILLSLAASPKKPDELENPMILAKMSAAEWIRFDSRRGVWEITKRGIAVLGGTNAN